MWMKEFSNFYMPKGDYIFHKNIYYPAIEHFFVAMMTDDPILQLKIARTKHPAEAKKMGRRFARHVHWHKYKKDVMLYALRQKFSNPDLANLLVSTGDAEIIHEVHWHDNYWASCVCPSCAHKDKYNLLGKLLMQIRNELNSYEFNRLVEQLPEHTVFYGTPVKRNGTVAVAV